MLPSKLAFVDVETTGMSASHGRIIEIGIVRVENNQITKTFQTLINPETHLPREIEMLTGITIKDLEDKPPFRQVADEILETLDECTFVAHNVRFDYSFIKYEFLRHNITFSAKHFCTVKLSRYLYPQETHHNLDAVIQRFGFSAGQRHRAYNDAAILWEFYKTSQRAFKEDVFLKAVHDALKRPSLPLKLNHDVLDSLPESPGVYIFYGADNSTQHIQQISDSDSQKVRKSENQRIRESVKPNFRNTDSLNTPSQIPLYIGKSVNIKDRVLSHFSGDIHSPKEMKISQQIQHIETITTAGELGALFLEAKMIKELLPLYNSLLRIKRDLVALSEVVDENGYQTVKMETLSRIDPDKLNTFIGFFKSRKEAKTYLTNIADEFGLCKKLLGLESSISQTNQACFAYRLNKCKGACIGEEKPIFYNLRFITACLKTKIKPWPFNGPILIKEFNEITKKAEYFLIDKWCYLGNFKINDEVDQSANELIEHKPEYIFDLDMYKILKRYLSKPENMKNIKILKTNTTKTLDLTVFNEDLNLLGDHNY